MPGRDAQWYYLSAAANAGVGNNVLAQQHAAQAVNMEPNNCLLYTSGHFDSPALRCNEILNFPLYFLY